MTDAPKRIWDFWPDDGGNAVVWREPCPFPSDDAEVFEYHRSDLSEDLVRAALEAAFNASQSPHVRLILEDDTRIAAIVASVMEKQT